MKKVLVLAPHADDAEFGMGGYLAKLARLSEGQVDLVIFAMGDFERSDGELVTEPKRQAEAVQAAASLGLNNLAWANSFGENFGDAAGQAVIIAEIERRAAPGYDEVFVCLPSFNQDHRALYNACVTAFRPGRLDNTGAVWAYEYPGNSWGPKAPAQGRRYVRLASDDFDDKMAALRMHVSQFKGRAGHITPDGAEMLARYRGSECGAETAELFYLLRAIE